MNNLVELFSGKHGNVKLLLNQPERKKLARMRTFLCAEEDVYEKLDHYDIANMSDAELEGLIDMSFDEEQIALPDDVEDLLEDLRRDVGEDKDKAAHSGSISPFWSRYKVYSIAVTVLLGLFFSGYLFMIQEDTGGDRLVAVQQELAAKADVIAAQQSYLEPIDISSSTEPDNRTMTAGGLFSLPINIMSDMTTLVTDEMPHVTASLNAAFTTFGVISSDESSAANSNADIVALGQEIEFPVWQPTVGVWSAAVDRNIDSSSVSSQIISDFEENYGSEVMTRGLLQGESGNIIAHADGLELHVFSFVLTEGESIYTIARETEVNPNIYNLINRALEQNSQIDTRSMGLNDRLVGVAARNGNQYFLSELIYDRARSSDTLRYTNCPSASLPTFSGSQFNSVSNIQTCFDTHAALTASAVNVQNDGLLKQK